MYVLARAALAAVAVAGIVALLVAIPAPTGNYTAFTGYLASAFSDARHFLNAVCTYNFLFPFISAAIAVDAGILLVSVSRKLLDIFTK